MADTEQTSIEQTVMDVVLSREGKRRYSNGDPLTLDPSDLRDIVRLMMAKCAALASRPAEVDDEGLPALPEETVLGTSRYGSIFRGYTPEQFRQGQRDAVAAYKMAESFCEANCCWSGHHEECFRSKEVAAPSHTTNKEK